MDLIVNKIDRKMNNYKKEISIQSEKLNMFYRIIDNDAEASIVIIPGHMDSSFSFKKILQNMNQLNQNFNYISFDIGWGNSDISERRYTKENQLEIVNRFLEETIMNHSDGTHLVGHSMGGELTLMKGFEENERLKVNTKYKSNIKSLTAICPSTYPRTLKQLEDLDIFCRMPNYLTQYIKNSITPEYVQNSTNKKIKKIINNFEMSIKDATEICNCLVKNNGLERALDVQKAMHFIKGSEYEMFIIV